LSPWCLNKHHLSKKSMRELFPAMFRLVALTWLSSAVGYKRIAAAVDGTIVSQSDFAGGRIAGYQAVQEVVNPLFEELELTMACCSDAKPVADEIAAKINLNEIHEKDKEAMQKEVEERYKDKCSKVDLRDSMEKGSKECRYAFIFSNAKFADLRYQATCVPAQMCAANVAGMTEGKIALYGVVLRIIMKTYGKLAYIGQGYQGACTAGMNEVNKGNIDYFYKSRPIMWGSTELGKLPPSIEVPGMGKVGVFDAFEPCPPDPYKGYLYIFDNRAWDKNASITNATQLVKEVEKLRKEKDAKEKAKKQLEALQRTLGEGAGEGAVLRKLQADIVL